MKYEWRVFFPCAQSATEQSERVGLYMEHLQTLFEELPSESEERTDEYIVCKPYFGLKVRGGKKAEVKLRQEVHEPVCIESYSKHKLGKGNVSDYSEEIVQLLTQNNLFEDEDHALLQESNIKSVSISKARKGLHLSSSCYLEICRIHVEDDESDWMSVCIEGDKHEEIEHHVRCSEDACVQLTRQLLSLHDEQFSNAENGNVQLPVLSGYPTFVLHIAAEQRDSNKEIRNLITRFNRYFAHEE